MSEVYPNYHDHIMHDNPLMEDEHFALVFAQAFINTNTVPTQEVTQRGENKIAFLKYILDQELLIADDFNGNSELYI